MLRRDSDRPCPISSPSSSTVYSQWNEPLRSSCTTFQNFSQVCSVIFKSSQFLTSWDDVNLFVIRLVNMKERISYQQMTYITAVEQCSVLFFYVSRDQQNICSNSYIPVFHGTTWIFPLASPYLQEKISIAKMKRGMQCIPCCLYILILSKPSHWTLHFGFSILLLW